MKQDDMMPEAEKSYLTLWAETFPPGTPVNVVKDLGEVERDEIAARPFRFNDNGFVIGLKKNGVYNLNRVIPLGR